MTDAADIIAQLRLARYARQRVAEFRYAARRRCLLAAWEARAMAISRRQAIQYMDASNRYNALARRELMDRDPKVSAVTERRR